MSYRIKDYKCQLVPCEATGNATSAICIFYRQQISKVTCWIDYFHVKVMVKRLAGGSP